MRWKKKRAAGSRNMRWKKKRAAGRGPGMQRTRRHEAGKGRRQEKVERRRGRRQRTDR